MPNDINQQEPVLEQEERENTPEELQSSQPAELPEDVKQRTKEQFDKLKENNQALKAELEQYKNAPSVLERFTKQPEPEYIPQPQAQPNQFNYAPQASSDLIGADGTISDIAELNRRLNQAEAAKKEAEEARRQINEYQLNQQARDLHGLYPEVDPNSPNFNPEAYDLVSKELLTQLVNTGKQDPIAAASKMAKYFREQPQAKEAQTKAVEQLQQATSSPQAGNYADIDDQELATMSRNDDDAILERMRRAGY
jgi:hypothetical protein